MNISGLVITYNEEKHIKQCLTSIFKVCNEVIIIDSFSTDDTVKIAKEMGATVIQQSFLGDGPQRIFGLKYCQNDWILNVDADEFLDEDSYVFLQQRKFAEQKYDAYSFRRRNFLGDKEINFADWYPDRACRFFNKKTASPSTAIVHQKVVATNLCKTDLHLIHHAWSNYHQLISKKNQYTDWQVQEMIKSNITCSRLSPISHGLSAFVKAYFIKKGIFYGIDGVTFSLIQSFFSYMKYAKLLDAIQQKNK